jgi:hypothetical protein
VSQNEYDVQPGAAGKVDEKMCDFCDREDCKLTKEEGIQRGEIIESNVESPMRSATEDTPMTYFFNGLPAYTLKKENKSSYYYEQLITQPSRFSVPIIIGEVGHGKNYKIKIEIINRYKQGETFTVVDEDGELEYMAKKMGLNYNLSKLTNDKTEITYNPNM